MSAEFNIRSRVVDGGTVMVGTRRRGLLTDYKVWGVLTSKGSPFRVARYEGTYLLFSITRIEGWSRLAGRVVTKGSK